MPVAPASAAMVELENYLDILADTKTSVVRLLHDKSCLSDDFNLIVVVLVRDIFSLSVSVFVRDKRCFNADFNLFVVVLVRRIIGGPDK